MTYAMPAMHGQRHDNAITKLCLQAAKTSCNRTSENSLFKLSFQTAGVKLRCYMNLKYKLYINTAVNSSGAPAN